MIPKRLLSVLAICMISLATQAAAQQAIAPVTQHGHTVWVNDGEGPASNANAGTNVANANPEPATKPHVVAYWSHREHRWKPVGLISPQEMKAAQTAADEVRRMVDKHETLKPVEATPASIERAIQNAAARHGIDENLVRAIIQVESGFNPSAVSRKGALGLMQLMPKTARALNVNNPFDPEQNVDAGVRHFKKLLENYNGDVRLSLAAYNAGSQAVDKHHGIPNYAETTSYVQRITRLYGGMNPWAADSPRHITVSRDAGGHLSFSNTE